MESETGGRGLPSNPASVLRCLESGSTAFKRKEAAAEVEAAAFSQVILQQLGSITRPLQERPQPNCPPAPLGPLPLWSLLHLKLCILSRLEHDILRMGAVANA